MVKVVNIVARFQVKHRGFSILFNILSRQSVNKTFQIKANHKPFYLKAKFKRGSFHIFPSGKVCVFGFKTLAAIRRDKSTFLQLLSQLSLDPTRKVYATKTITSNIVAHFKVSPIAPEEKLILQLRYLGVVFRRHILSAGLVLHKRNNQTAVVHYTGRVLVAGNSNFLSLKQFVSQLRTLCCNE